MIRSHSTFGSLTHTERGTHYICAGYVHMFVADEKREKSVPLDFAELTFARIHFYFKQITLDATLSRSALDSFLFSAFFRSAVRAARRDIRSFFRLYCLFLRALEASQRAIEHY